MIDFEESESASRRFMVHLFFGICLLSLSALLTGCPKNEGPGKSISVSQRPLESPTAVVPGAVAFNGERAMDHVRKQVEIGPRPPGSPELGKAREYIIKTLTDSGIKVFTEEFTADDSARS